MGLRQPCHGACRPPSRQYKVRPNPLHDPRQDVQGATNRLDADAPPTRRRSSQNDGASRMRLLRRGSPFDPRPSNPPFHGWLRLRGQQRLGLSKLQQLKARQRHALLVVCPPPRPIPATAPYSPLSQDRRGTLHATRTPRPALGLLGDNALLHCLDSHQVPSPHRTIPLGDPLPPGFRTIKAARKAQ